MKRLFFHSLTLVSLLLVQINSYADDSGLSVQQLSVLLQDQREQVLFLDVRDPVEIMFVGFTDEVDANIPYLMVDRTSWDKDKNRFQLYQNPKFTNDVEALLKKKQLEHDAIIVTMCRSGSERGKPSADFLRHNGFPNAKYLIHGFQGQALKAGPQKGLRIQNGWQNSTLPWQAKPNPEKIYRPQL